jgi:hypothetical protein
MDFSPLRSQKDLKLTVEVSAGGKPPSEIRALRPSRLSLLLVVLRNLINKPKKIWRNDFFKEQKRLAFKQIFGHAPESLN